MALSDNDKKILGEIVAAQGDCLESKRCQSCPFRAMCLPEFLFTNHPTQAQRAALALSVLTHHLLIDDDAETPEYQWDQK